MKKTVVILIAVIVTSCGSRKVDESSQSVEERTATEAISESVNHGKTAWKFKESKRFDFSKFNFEVTATDSLPYFFSLDGLEYFGTGDLSASNQQSSTKADTKTVYVHDTLEIRDTIYRTEYVYQAQKTKKQTEVRQPSFWWYVWVFAIGLVIGLFVKFNLKQLL